VHNSVRLYYDEYKRYQAKRFDKVCVFDHQVLFRYSVEIGLDQG